MNIDLNKIENIYIEGIDRTDHPKYCDAFIATADYDGREMTDEELDWLHENERDFVHEEVYKWLY